MLDKAGKLYKTVTIDKRVWMAENMAWQDDSVTCNAKSADSDFAKNYGCLYTFEDAQKVCPSGWYLPGKQEFDALLAYASANKTSASVFEALAAKVSWKHNDAETITGGDDFGFAALPAGWFGGGNYSDFGEQAIFWSSEQFDNDNTKAYTLQLNSTRVSAGTRGYAGVGYGGQVMGYSVRCIKIPECGEHSKWDSDKHKCVCEGRFTGENCDECLDGWDITQNCEKTSPMTDAAGKSYLTVGIGSQIWMAQNMAYQGDEVTCYANTKSYGDPDFIKNYGCLYTWEDAEKVCPAGWHLPSNAEFSSLRDYVHAHRTSTSDFLALIANSDAWKDYPNQGGDDFGFGALPAGYRIEEVVDFSAFGEGAYFWSSTENESSNSMSYALGIENSSAGAPRFVKEKGLSVRCLKSPKCGENEVWDSNQQKCVCAGHFDGENCQECAEGWDIATNCTTTLDMTDAAGNSYKTTEINGQIWMAQNMASNKAADGSTVSCHANTQAAPNGDPEFVAHYGCLYNWDDANKVCPAGWHLPSNAEFESLLDYVGNDVRQRSDNLRDENWNSGRDLYGFAALPASGGENQGGGDEFWDFGAEAFFWSATAIDTYDAYIMRIESMTTTTGAYTEDAGKAAWMSVRCLKGAAVTE